MMNALLVTLQLLDQVSKNVTNSISTFMTGATVNLATSKQEVDSLSVRVSQSQQLPPQPSQVFQEFKLHAELLNIAALAPKPIKKQESTPMN